MERIETDAPLDAQDSDNVSDAIVELVVAARRRARGGGGQPQSHDEAKLVASSMRELSARAEALGLGAEAGEAQEGSGDPKGALVAFPARRLA